MDDPTSMELLILISAASDEANMHSQSKNLYCWEYKCVHFQTMKV